MDEGGRTDSIYQNGSLTTPRDFAGDYNSDQVVCAGQNIYYAGWSGVSRYSMSGIGPSFKESDPRKGPLFSIVEGWLEAKEKERRKDS